MLTNICCVVDLTIYFSVWANNNSDLLMCDRAVMKISSPKEKNVLIPFFSYTMSVYGFTDVVHITETGIHVIFSSCMLLFISFCVWSLFIYLSAAALLWNEPSFLNFLQLWLRTTAIIEISNWVTEEHMLTVAVIIFLINMNDIVVYLFNPFYRLRWI